MNVGQDDNRIAAALAWLRPLVATKATDPAIWPVRSERSLRTVA
jgi:hypothetical protein